MSDDSEDFALPSRQEVEAKLLSLIEGHSSREDVSSWAGDFVLIDSPHVGDPAVWRTLNHLFGADMPTTDRPYLFEVADFHHWLEELREADKDENL